MEKDKYKITDRYVIFHGSFLSNWYPCNIRYDGNDFYSSEQLFMWLKAKSFEDHETADKILLCSTPKEAKSLGRLVKGFNDETWDKIKVHCMYLAVYWKFSQNESLKNELIKLSINTNNNTYRCFVEGSQYDTIWGIGIDWKDKRAEDCRCWKGQNLLGNVLDAVMRKVVGQSLYNEF